MPPGFKNNFFLWPVMFKKVGQHCVNELNQGFFCKEIGAGTK